MDSDQHTLEETYRLAKENNAMLHAMRRNAFWGGILKIIIYAAFILVPLWFYMQYLAPVMNQALEAMQKVEGTGANAQAQISSLQNIIKDLQSKVPGLGQ